MINTAKSRAAESHVDQLLDDALAGTFPASDPVGSLTAEKRRPGQDVKKPAPSASRSAQLPEG